jgi:hypothetical protein
MLDNAERGEMENGGKGDVKGQGTKQRKREMK